MTRTAWGFTMCGIWLAPQAGPVVCYALGVAYGALAFWSWYRESKHKEVAHV